MMTNRTQPLGIIRSFDLPDECRNDHVTIRTNDGSRPFRATQYVRQKELEDGTVVYNEADIYGYSDALREALEEHTHTPIEDIRVQSLPVAEGGIL